MSHLKFDTLWLKCLIRLPRKPCEVMDLASRKNYHIRCRKRFFFFLSFDRVTMQKRWEPLPVEGYSS